MTFQCIKHWFALTGGAFHIFHDSQGIIEESLKKHHKLLISLIFVDAQVTVKAHGPLVCECVRTITKYENNCPMLPPFWSKMGHHMG